MTDSLDQLTPDPRNARIHSPKNLALLTDALRDVGAARSIVIDEDGVVLTGNATLEAARAASLQRVQVVGADGQILIAVLSPPPGATPTCCTSTSAR